MLSVTINDIVFFLEIAIENWDISHAYTDGTNTLGLVVFGIVFGITLGKMGESGKALLDFFTALSEATMIITNWVIWYGKIELFFFFSNDLRIILRECTLIEISFFFL